MKTNGPGRPPHDDVLTPAEWTVAEQVRHGMTHRRIAERMGVSLDAVKFHVSNALTKLGFSSREKLRRWDEIAKGTALDQMRRSAMDAQTTTDSYMMLGQVARTTRDEAVMANRTSGWTAHACAALTQRRGSRRTYAPSSRRGSPERSQPRPDIVGHSFSAAAE